MVDKINVHEAAYARERVLIGNLMIDLAGLVNILERCQRAVTLREPLHVVTANLMFLTTARKNSRFTDVVNRAGLVVADGMPVVWLSKLTGTTIPARITGHDLVYHFAEMASANRQSIYLLGGAPGSADQAAERLVDMYPGLQIAGTMQGEFSANGDAPTEPERREIVETIRSAQPDYLLVALGCPKQELWISKFGPEIGVPVMIGVGSVFEVLAGKARRAPPWMQRCGLEWTYRLKQEPGRLGRRYLLNDGPTAVLLAAQALRSRLQHTQKVSATLEERSGVTG